MILNATLEESQGQSLKGSQGIMKSKDLIGYIEQAIAQVKLANQKVLSIESLEDYLSKLKAVLPDTDPAPAIDLEEKKLNKEIERINREWDHAHERNLAHYRAQEEFRNKLIDAAFQFANTALKSSILINGGAAVAMLAFVGHIWDVPLAQSVSGYLANSIRLFCFGVFCGAVSTGMTYMAQYGYVEKWVKFAVSFHVFTILLVLASYGFFMWGSYAKPITPFWHRPLCRKIYPFGEF